MNECITLIPTEREQMIIDTASPELSCTEIADILSIEYLVVWRCVHKFKVAVKKNPNRKIEIKSYAPPKAPKRLTEQQKVTLSIEASRQKTIKDLCRIIRFGSYDTVWRFCTKHKLPYKMKWEAKKEKVAVKNSEVFQWEDFENGLF